MARGKREKYFIKKTLLKMNNNNPCPAEEVIQKRWGGWGEGGNKKEKHYLGKSMTSQKQCNTENNVITFSSAEMLT